MFCSFYALFFCFGFAQESAQWVQSPPQPPVFPF